MCEFCIKHGEGKKWYEVMEHYSKELASSQDRQAFICRFVKTLSTDTHNRIEKLKWAKKRLPMAYRFVRRMGTAMLKTSHYGQVVPLEDLEKIVDLVQSITRIPCICRSITTGKNDARYCMMLGMDPTGLIGDWPDLETASLETLDREQAKGILREFDQAGLIHSIWTFKTPYIGAICNCDHDCLAYRIQVGSDLMNVMFKGEYVAQIDLGECNGCRNCQRLCQFGAVEYSVVGGKCIVNTAKCYGCGVCRNGCKKEAISLVEKIEK